MMRLKSANSAPPGGFQFVDKPTQFKVHGWSLRSAGAQWYQEQLRRGKNTTIEHCMSDVETFTCNELLKLNGWETFVEINSEWRVEDYMPMDGYDRELSSPSSKGVLFTVVYPFCAKDGTQALKLMKWIAELTPPSDHLLVLSHDYQTPPSIVEAIANAAKVTFRAIKTLSYAPPSADQWPPTVAFKAAANFMQKQGTPWLWMEADAVPLTPDWLTKLQEAYWGCGKAFAGPIVELMNHMNGTGVYPANTPKRIPRALEMMRTAWDITMRPEMINDCFNLHPLFYHAWTSDGRDFHPFNGGNVPTFPPGTPLLSKIPKESVVFHRNKSLDLIDRLRERMLVPA